MTTTTYYDLNIVEGTDIVNPLTVDNPNYEKIDEAMHDNAVSGVTLASEIANATVHAITRENSECAVIRFIATSEWKAGDSVTVDGVPVTALLPSGETLPDRAYVINANVLCILTGTNLTVYSVKKIDDASDIPYNDTNVAVALTKINSDLAIEDVSITAIDSSVVTNVSSFPARKMEATKMFSFGINFNLSEAVINEGTPYVRGFAQPLGSVGGTFPIFNCLYRNIGSGATRVGTCYIDYQGRLVCGYRDHVGEIVGYDQVFVTGVYPYT